jgi:ribose transport system ATP-binding protein
VHSENGSSAGSIKIAGLSKSYGSIDVLRNVNLEFRSGEVHALLGANGAGKSTLLGCMSGATKPTSGSIHINDAEFDGFTPREALGAGISIIYQQFQLAATLSVSDNVFLGDELRNKWGQLRKREQRRITSEVLARIGLSLDPDHIVRDLSVGEQQGIEIARSIRREPNLLILDEPTAALGKHEVDALLTLVKRLAHQLGVAVIYVTHLLGEVMEVADRVSILREGRVLWTRDKREVTTAEIITAISPDARTIDPVTSRKFGQKGWVEFEDFETSFCGPIDLSIDEGEVIGVYGMLGSGRTNLLETIAGARQPWNGTLRLAGEKVSIASTSEALKFGVALVASDRISQSLFASLSALENLMMPHYSAISRAWRHPRTELRTFHQLAADLNLHPANPGNSGSSFSGGNAQKLVLGRWLTGLRNIKLLLLDEPTQGVDVGSRAQIYNLLRLFADVPSGHSVLFATSDPEEAIMLADRIVVLVDGKVTHVVEPAIGEAALLSLAQSVEVTHGASHST